ncbi:MAG: GNAT family protein [Candidatus Nanoarchaeia archaeon]|nr:GNAT family protein [Candidatus Nanoarchaeia archaeon]
MKLKGEKITLKSPSIFDYKNLQKDIRSDDILKSVSIFKHPNADSEGFRRTIDFLADFLSGRRKYFVIAPINVKKAVGVINLSSIDWINKNAQIGYWIGKEHWGKGYATEAIKLVLKYGFENMGLHKIYATVFEENIGSKKVLEKNGFCFEGIKIKEELKYGDPKDLHSYYILQSKYLAERKQFKNV